MYWLFTIFCKVHVLFNQSEHEEEILEKRIDFLLVFLTFEAKAWSVDTFAHSHHHGFVLVTFIAKTVLDGYRISFVYAKKRICSPSILAQSFIFFYLSFIVLEFEILFSARFHVVKGLYGNTGGCHLEVHRIDVYERRINIFRKIDG